VPRPARGAVRETRAGAGGLAVECQTPWV